jgi:hypothetical protein
VRGGIACARRHLWLGSGVRHATLTKLCGPLPARNAEGPVRCERHLLDNGRRPRDIDGRLRCCMGGTRHVPASRPLANAYEPRPTANGDCGNLWLCITTIHTSCASSGVGLRAGSRPDGRKMAASQVGVRDRGIHRRLCRSGAAPSDAPCRRRWHWAGALEHRRGGGGCCGCASPKALRSQMAGGCVLVPGCCTPKDRRSYALYRTEWQRVAGDALGDVPAGLRAHGAERGARRGSGDAISS